MEIELGKRDKPAEADDPQHDIGKMEVVDDAEMEQFYGSATSDAYRLKSELVSQCMTEIGMGWYLLSLSALSPSLIEAGSSGSSSS